jgi:nucleoside-diphosphate-sugar epimerase
MDNGSKIEKKRISILGCGWLGFPLAQRLYRRHITSQIKGSTTSPDKLEAFAKNGIEGFLLPLTPQFDTEPSVVKAFFDADILVISLPPRLNKNEAGFYLQEIEAVISEIKNSPIQDIIFISSTGIYPDLNIVVTENDVKTPGESASPEMVAAENLLESLRPDRNVTILRLGGLLGYNRIPGKYVKGQKDMTTASIPVNYIHRNDAAEIIITVLEKGILNETFNIVAPIHSTRKEVYEASCAQFGWEAPTFMEPVSPPDFKIISADKFDQHYHYTFQFPDPLQFYYSLEDDEA